ncbi:hypothetical protein BH24DEI1_BH24DEI1_06500 [soil metagenome]|jgi:Uma2 family endonuclease
MAIPTPRPADRASEPNCDAPPGPLRMSVEHYYKMAEAGILEADARYELIHGVIYKMAPIGPKHATRLKKLEGRLERCFSDRAVVFTQHPLRISEGDEPQPDILVVKPPIDQYEERHPKPEDVLLVVEVATTLESDRTLKQGLYARAGIPEYWILSQDPARGLPQARRRRGALSRADDAR